jgi:hypothetical protein
VTLSLRPLSLTELQIALAIDPHDEQLQELKVFSSLPEFISNAGGPLLQILPNNTVIPVHASLKDFLFHAGAVDAVLQPHFPVAMPKKLAQSDLAITCLTYLSFNTFTERYHTESLHYGQILEYAACNWYHHAIGADDTEAVFSLVIKFLPSMQGFQWLEGLQELFGKSAEDILVIQSEIRSWALAY